MCWKVGKKGLSVGAINSYQVGPGFTERNSIGQLNWTDLKLKALMKKQCQKEGYWFNENDTYECDIDIYMSSKCFGLYENWKYSTEFHMINEDDRCAHIYICQEPTSQFTLQTSSICTLCAKSWVVFSLFTSLFPTLEFLNLLCFLIFVNP